MSCVFFGDEPAEGSRSLHEAGSRAVERGSEPSTVASPKADETCQLQLGDDCLILTGPTAAGKTKIALHLAQRLDAEIVSVDSMAVYRELDIGTAKPSAAERGVIPHHALDLVAPSEPFSVAAWLSEAARAVEGIRRRGRRVLFVGGTPLYLKALREGLSAGPGANPDLRKTLARRLEREGAAQLHGELATLAPEAAARIHPNDGRRIIRALEVASMPASPADGSQLANWGRLTANATAAPLLVVDVPRKLLAERIAERVQRMFQEGLVEEVRAAVAAGGIGPTAQQGAGYREVLSMLAGRLSREEAVEQTIRRTRQLAKRQRTWLRSFSDAVWICS